MSQMISSGSGAAISRDEVALALLDHARRRSRAARALRRRPRSAASARGVKPRETMRAQPRVARVVHVDHRAEELVEGLGQVGDVAAPARAEELGVAAHLEHVGVRHQPTSSRGPSAGSGSRTPRGRRSAAPRAASRTRPRAPPGAAARTRGRRARSRRRTARASAPRVAPPRTSLGKGNIGGRKRIKGAPMDFTIPARDPGASSTSSTPSSSARSRRSSASTRSTSTTAASTRAPTGRTAARPRREWEELLARDAPARRPRRAPALRAAQGARRAGRRRTSRWRSSASTSPRKGLGLHNDLQNESSIVGNFPQRAS